MSVLGVVGAGTMGRGIAQLALQSGLGVVLYDAFPEALSKAGAAIASGLAKGVERGKLSKADAEAAGKRLKIAQSLQDLSVCDFVVEAVVEDLEPKRKLFAELEGAVSPKALLATNTSSLKVADIFSGLKNPGRSAGMHFFNPPVTMKLVEVIRAPKTTEDAFQKAWGLAKSLTRIPVAVTDTPGFLVNRVLRSYYLTAQRLAAAGAGTFAELDSAVKAEGGVPMGPFELMDFIGLEVNFKITQEIYEGLGRPEALKPHPIQESLVAAGCKGRKSGRGFYLYGDKGPAGENPEALALLPANRNKIFSAEIFDRIMSAIAEESRRVVAEGVASEEGVDTAVKLAMNFPKGPFEWAKVKR